MLAVFGVLADAKAAFAGAGLLLGVLRAALGHDLRWHGLIAHGIVERAPAKMLGAAQIFQHVALRVKALLEHAFAVGPGRVEEGVQKIRAGPAAHAGEIVAALPVLPGGAALGQMVLVVERHRHAVEAVALQQLGRKQGLPGPAVRIQALYAPVCAKQDRCAHAEIGKQALIFAAISRFSVSLPVHRATKFRFAQWLRMWS